MHFMTFTAAIVAIILAGMEVDLFIPSFPELIRTFNLTPFLVQLTVSVNFFSYCIASLFAGNMGDRFGRRPVMLGGLFVFFIGSVLCVWAPTFPMLVLGRFFQGAGMAAPAVLSYVVATDLLPREDHPKYLGILNSIVTFAMASAPVLGSFMSQYYSWKGSFWLLLCMGVFAWVMVYFFIPHTTQPDKNVSLSLKSYKPLLQSREFLYLGGGIIFLITGYWTFIAMGPILYMESMKVPLSQFGFYQGAILFAYALVSASSPIWMPHVSKKKCLSVTLTMLACVVIAMVLMSVTVPDTPWIITILMILFAIPFIAPINFLYPDSLHAVPDSKGRASALINCGRLLFTGIGVEFVSYIYTGVFIPVAVFIACTTFLAIGGILKSHAWSSAH